jgi:cytochrome c556
MIQKGKNAMAAAAAKDKDKIVEAGGEMNTTCDNCHAKYSRQ